MHDIDFTIEIILGASPLSRAPYHMSISELTELKMQLQELLDKSISVTARSLGEPPYCLYESNTEP